MMWGSCSEIRGTKPNLKLLCLMSTYNMEHIDICIVSKLSTKLQGAETARGNTICLHLEDKPMLEMEYAQPFFQRVVRLWNIM